MGTTPQSVAGSAISSMEDALFRKVTWRLLPILFLSYIVAYIDRVNVGFAKLQMLTDLNFSAQVYGLGSGIFFVGFLLFEVPSNLLLYRFGARTWLARIMITWGVVSVLTMFVHTPAQFYTVRFLLGVAEAGFLPGVVYYLAQWFPQYRQGRVMSVLITAAAIGGVIVGPLSGWIMAAFSHSSGLRNWQWLFLLQGAPAMVVACLLWGMLPDRPDTVAWLDAREKALLQSLVEGAQRHLPRKDRIAEVLRSANVWWLALVLLALNLGIYAVIFWTPTIIHDSGVTDLRQIGYLSALPYVASAIAMLLLGRSSDRFDERRWHLALACLGGALGLVLTAVAASPQFRIIGVMLATAMFIGSTPLVWALGGNFMTGRAAATGYALMNAIAALGGLFGPYVMGLAQDLTGNTTIAVLAIACVSVLGGLCVFALPAIPKN
ncbi:MFS transporter [Paraburkholderia sp. JHI2823]|uniref:MFS transporter n=1 Tax=Paraburkholderia sp. JHI2823 TaxID=3112960 RepID=UPI0031739B89